MTYNPFSWSVVATLLCVLVLHSCQQPKLHVVGDDPAQETSKPIQELTQKAMQSPEATKTHAISGVILTSSSDSSPDSKEDTKVSSNNARQLSIFTRQDDSLSPNKADIATSEASNLSKKRPATAQVSMKDEASKKEKLSPSHNEWFVSFAEVTKQIEQDTEDGTAWDNMEQLLNEGAKNQFLKESITYANDSNLTSEYEYTPLHYAAAKGLLRLVKKLVEQHDIPVDIQTQDNKNTPLHLAASNGHLDVAKFLVERSIDLNSIDSEGGSAVHYAAAGRNGEINRDVIEYLVEKGANFLRLAKNGSSPLSAAVFAGNMSVIEYWVDTYMNNPDPNVDELTTKALKLAKYRKENIAQEREIQSDIVRSLTDFLEARRCSSRES